MVFSGFFRVGELAIDGLSFMMGFGLGISVGSLNAFDDDSLENINVQSFFHLL